VLFLHQPRDERLSLGWPSSKSLLVREPLLFQQNTPVPSIFTQPSIRILINTLFTAHHRQLSDAMSLHCPYLTIIHVPEPGAPSRPQGRWGQSQGIDFIGIVIGVRSIHFGSLEGVTESLAQTLPHNYYPSKTRTCSKSLAKTTYSPRFESRLSMIE
jgi:hypothetical protein